MSKKPEDKVIRASISLPKGLWQDVEEYRDREHVVTTADAVRRLLLEALRAAKQKARK
jgi:hypothetical protein